MQPLKAMVWTCSSCFCTSAQEIVPGEPPGQKTMRNKANIAAAARIESINGRKRRDEGLLCHVACQVGVPAHPVEDETIDRVGEPVEPSVHLFFLPTAQPAEVDLWFGLVCCFVHHDR